MNMLPEQSGKWGRAFKGALGLLLLGCAAAAFWDIPDLDWQQFGIVALLALFGGNCVWAAWHNRKAWIEWIGPLP